MTVSLKMTQRPPSCNCGLEEIHQPPSCQSVSPEAQKNATKLPHDDFLRLKIALMALSDPSDDMLRISAGLRSFVKMGQDTVIYRTAQELYDCGLAGSTSGNKAPQEGQAFGKGLKSEMPTDKMKHFESRDTNVGRDTDGDSVQEHEPGASMEANAIIYGLLKLSDKFARGIEHLQNGTLHKEPTSSQVWKFSYELNQRNHVRHAPTNFTTIETLLKESNRIDSRHSPIVDSAYMRREIEISTFYDSFDFWYRSASSASSDKKTSVRLGEKTKMPQNKETVEEFSSHILHLATAIQFDCAVLVSYLNWINREKVWGLLDEGRYKAHCLVRRLVKFVEDGSVPQSILEALDAPVTCATSLNSSEPHTVAIDRQIEHDDSSTGQASSIFENRLRQVCRLHNVFYWLIILLIICTGPTPNEKYRFGNRRLGRGGGSQWKEDQKTHAHVVASECVGYLFW